MSAPIEAYKTTHNVRIVTATALFDGHDASINIMRRILQESGAEVVHLGHNRSVMDIVDAAIEEDAQGIAVSSYQGGHMEFFKYMIDLLKERNAPHIKVFGGGGGVIVPEEVRELEAYGVTKIYSPDDGSKMGLQGMINHMLEKLDFSTIDAATIDLGELSTENRPLLAKLVSAMELIEGKDSQPSVDLADLKKEVKDIAARKSPPVIGITGTGGAGKSSLTDELIFRFLLDFKDMSIAVVSCDPSKRKTGGALLGDRIRMNSIGNPKVYMRSLATRKSQTEVPENLPDVIELMKAAGFDLIIVETAGIGQGDSHISDIVDLPMYVMTSEFGAASQLEKIDMLDFAELVVINKFEKRGGDDAVTDVRKQMRRNMKLFDGKLEDMPVYGTIASKFNDDGVTSFYHAILEKLREKKDVEWTSKLPSSGSKTSTSKTIIIPPERVRYLADISDTIRSYHNVTEEQEEVIRKVWHLEETRSLLQESQPSDEMMETLKREIDKGREEIKVESNELLEQWEEIKERYSGEELVYQVRDREIRVPLYTKSLSHSRIPKISLPRFKDPGEIYRWLREENLPGYFPYTSGLFPLKRVGEDPTRMFAGEGDPARTNRRFKLLSADSEAKRLSTAFDAVTLFGFDPQERPDIYGKVGTSGVSVCSLDDVKVLYGGFDLCSPNTSVSMTINGPAPIILAMFLNTAIDQEVDKVRQEKGADVSQAEYEEIKVRVLNNVRGTVQADILKEDQGQNSCIFSIDFALKMMGDIQEYFIDKKVRNFYSVSISGYHIAEAGANPITQLALTLANGFTYVEYYLSRGMPIDTFAPNLSFFFSNGMDPEYTVIGRVARRIWSVAMKEKYGGSARSQMLKYHIQTSGRSLHAQDIQFNDIRTTLQALCAIYDNCNSLHTNSYDEAITTPTNESVRRALAIQMIINREWGLTKNENMNQGSFIVEELTHLVEEAVLMEFDRIASRGGVLGAMETGYQRGKIQEESLYYEMLKHSGEHPIIGVNTFIDPDADAEATAGCIELARATEQEKESQLKRLHEFQSRHADKSGEALERLQQVALNRGNIFEELMETVKTCSLGQITQALNEVGGQYRRNM